MRGTPEAGFGEGSPRGGVKKGDVVIVMSAGDATKIGPDLLSRLAG